MNPEIARTGLSTSWRYDNDFTRTTIFYRACRWMLRLIVILFIIATAAMLTGCDTALKIPETVNIAVPTPCIDPASKPPRPALMSDAELLALDSYRFTWALWGDRLERAGYEAQLEAVVEGCSWIPAVTR